jgi:hypothetical protein
MQEKAKTDPLGQLSGVSAYETDFAG